MSEESDDFNLHEVPLKALNVSVRLKLARFLNPQQTLLSNARVARDFRGLAELMGFAHLDIQNFMTHDDPTEKILHAWETNSSEQYHTVGELLSILDEMGRYDVINDLKEDMVTDAKKFKTNECRNKPIQDSMIGSSSSAVEFPADNPNHITLQDIMMLSGELAQYDAYICYADSDLRFVRWLATRLESPPVNIKLCIRDRDLPGGTFEYDAFVHLVQERCHRILIVLSPEFLNTPECEHQAKYVASLAAEYRSRRIIPIVYEPCEIPAILKYISKVDFSRLDIQDWVWNKLIASIRVPHTSLFVPPEQTCPPPPSVAEYPLLPEVPSNDSLTNLDSATSNIDSQMSSEPISERVALVQSTSGNKSSKGQKLVQSIRSFISSSSSSSASSGFHSQSNS